MNTIAERIKEAMQIRGLKQSDIVEMTGINKGALSSYLSGRYSPKQNNIYLLAKALDVNEAWLMGADVPINRMVVSGLSDTISIPVYGRVAAGQPIHVEQNIIGWEDIPKDWKGEYVGLKIKGDSMSPRIHDGDTIIVRKQPDAESGNVVVAIINGEDATCKKLIKHPDGITLHSFNPLYEPMYFSKKDAEIIPVVIWGRVVENRSKF